MTLLQQLKEKELEIQKLYALLDADTKELSPSQIFRRVNFVTELAELKADKDRWFKLVEQEKKQELVLALINSITHSLTSYLIKPMDIDQPITDLGKSKKDDLVPQNTNDAVEGVEQKPNKLKISKLPNENKLRGILPILIQAFYYIRNASEEDGWLEFNKPFQYLNGEIYKKIFIRRCYSEIYDRLKSKKRMVATILGTPGIGKSIFLIYFIYRWFKDGGSVYFEHFTFKDCIFDPNTETFISHNEIQPEENSIILCDSVEPTLVHPTILVCSPIRDTIHNDFKKQDGHEFFYMPIWNSNEVELLIDGVSEFKNQNSMILSRFEVFNGVPRRILSPPKMTIDKEIEMIVKSCKNVKKLFRYEAIHSLKNPHDFHSLVLMVASDDYREFQYQIASKTLARELANQVKAIHMDSLKDSIQFIRQNGIGTLAGDLFEPYLLFLMEPGGIFKMQDLESAKEEDIELGPAKRTIFYDVKEFNHTGSPQELMVPSKQNFSAIDFIIGKNLCNVTINLKHDFIINEDISSLILKCDESKLWNIVYVIPKDMGINFRRQNLVFEKPREVIPTTENPEEMQKLKEEENLKQKAMRMADKWAQAVILIDI